MSKESKSKESKKHPVSDWKYEVSNGDTKLGYAEWLEHQLEADEFDKKRKP